MKQIDYLRLVATGRKSTHYARPSDADDALTGLAGVTFFMAFISTVGIAMVASYFGEPMSIDKLSKPIAFSVLPGVAYFACGLFIGGAPRLVRYCMAFVGATVVVALLYYGVAGRLDGWYLYVPPALFALLVSIGAIRQL